MKEYKSKTGGRPLYNEDMHNLQELALSITEFFGGSGLSFVLSGCEITARNGESGDIVRSVSSGYVYLNGKVRRVEAREIGSVPLPVYICEKDIDTGNGITYADMTSDEQYIDYGAEVRTSQETLSGQYITADDDTQGFPNVKTCFFNHYSLIKDTDLEQYVKSLTTFGNGIKTAFVKLLKANASADVTIDTDGNLVMMLGNYLDHQYSLMLYKTTGELGICDNGKPMWKMGVNADGKLIMPPMSVGDIAISGKTEAGEVKADTIEATSVSVKSIECKDNENDTSYMLTGTEEIEGKNVDEGKWKAPYLRFTSKSGNTIAETLIRIYGNTINLSNNKMSVNLQLNPTTRRFDLDKGLCVPEVVSEGDIYENGKKLEDTYLKKATGDNGWHELINANTGEAIPGLKVRNKYDMLLQIKGTIPKELLQYPYEGSNYMARLPIRIPETISFGDSEEMPVGNNFHSVLSGNNMIIPTDASNKALFAFLATLSPMGIAGHSPSEVDADCILAVKSDRYLYLLGARFADGCCWNGRHIDNNAPYALGDVVLNLRTLLV